MVTKRYKFSGDEWRTGILGNAFAAFWMQMRTNCPRSELAGGSVTVLAWH